MPFDGSTLSTATTGAFVGSVFSDTFSVGGSDVDMIRLDLVGGRLYTIDVDNGTAGDFYLRVFDAFGNEVRANDDGIRATDDVVFSLSPYLEFSSNYSGVYYIAISPYYLDDYDPATTAGRVTPENPLAVTAGTLTVTDFGTTFWASAGAINAITAEDLSDETDLFRDEGESLRVAFFGAVDSPADVDMARIDLNKNDIVVIDVNGLEGNGTVLRIFDDTGVQIGFDDDSGFGEDAGLIFVAPVLDDYYIGISGEGNGAYVALDGTGTVAGTVGDFEVIVHRNPTQIGSSLGNVFNGSDANDYIVSLAGADTVSGNDGNDILAGGDDNDSLSGGAGRDVLYGEHGDDTLNGGDGSDVLSGGIGNDLLDGGASADTLDGGAGNDVFNLGSEASGIDTLIDATGTDTVFSTIARSLQPWAFIENLILQGNAAVNGTGNAAANSIIGNANNNTLAGLGDNDTLWGGGGDDFIFGQAGKDRLRGDAGNDRFVYQFASDSVTGAQCDGIADFDHSGNDVIDLRDVFGGVLTFVGTGAFTGIGQVRINDIAGADLAVEVNLSGNTTPEMQIYLFAVTAASMGADDFML